MICRLHLTIVGAVGLITGCADLNHGAARQLMETDRQFSALSVAKGAPAAFRAYMADDATMLPNGEDAITGRKAIDESMAPLASGTLKWQPKQAEASLRGDLGYTWGTYEFRVVGINGQPRVSYGKYVTVWRKQPDGTWKAILDTGNQSPPPK